MERLSQRAQQPVTRSFRATAASSAAAVWSIQPARGNHCLPKVRRCFHPTHSPIGSHLSGSNSFSSVWLWRTQEKNFFFWTVSWRNVKVSKSASQARLLKTLWKLLMFHQRTARPPRWYLMQKICNDWSISQCWYIAQSYEDLFQTLISTYPTDHILKHFITQAILHFIKDHFLNILFRLALNGTICPVWCSWCYYYFACSFKDKIPSGK